MGPTLREFFDASGFMPHGHCFLWRPEILWLHVISDAMIVASYYAIPLMLIYFVQRRRDMRFRGILVMFGAFILACGTTHLIEIVTVWEPMYALQGIVKLATGLISAATAIVLVPLVPRALALPSPAQLARAEREKAEEALLRRRAEEERESLARQRLQALGTFAGGVAHEFNNLLTGVLGNAQHIAQRARLDPELAESLREIEAAANRAADITRQVVAYAGSGRFVVEPVDVSEIVREMLPLVNAVISKRALLGSELETGLPRVEADGTQMRQLVLNLLTNASEALGRGEGTITVRSGTQDVGPEGLHWLSGEPPLEPGRYVFIEVQDDGPGMDKEARRRAFEPFFTTREPGRGLGLAAVLGTARAHRGGVLIESEIGQGTRVRVLLATASGTHAAGSPRRGATAPVRQGARAILVVDDEPLVRRVAASILEGQGFTVLPADDGREAVEIFAREHERLLCVVLDLTMPGPDGVETMAALRRADASVPVVVSSGFGEDEARQRLAATPPDAFLAKPYTPKGLLEVVRGVTAGSAGPA